MKHLSIDEMIDFVSINKLDDESLKLASVINAYILRCDACRKKLKYFRPFLMNWSKWRKKNILLK